MERKNGRILVVDDNAQILNALQLLLKPEFEETTCIKNPNQLPSLLHHNNYDIILLDMNFRSGDNSGNEGLFWLSEILKADPLMMVIMITAYGDIDTAVRALKAGAVGFLQKPFNDQALVELVNRAF